jgi:hypothetical protein
VWLDDAGAVQTSTAALPTDRTTFVPLASVTSEAGQIMEVVDLRGETFLAVPDTALIGLTATAAEINQALAGINPTVDAAALNVLTGGAGSAADNEHHHENTRHG